MRPTRSCGRGSKPSCRSFPDIKVEIYIENRLADIVAERYDAGVRLGEQVAKDMIAVRIGPDWRIVVVGSPSYFASRTAPQTPHDLTGHRCINLRLTTYGGLYAWEFEKAGQTLNVRVDGQLVFNSTAADPPGQPCRARPGLRAGGHGVAAHRHGEIGHVRARRLVPAFPGYHLYYPSRRQASPAFAAVVDALRYRD